jgi:hypothetical protein
VLRKLLRRIEDENHVANPTAGHYTFLVSHAWTDGPMMHLVYTAPPSDIIWGLARDTRMSLIDPAPWPDVDEAVTYYLLDLEEDWMSASFGHPGEPDTILWRGYPLEADLSERPSDIPEAYRCTPPPEASSAKPNRKQNPPVINEPRRYADPL